VTDPRFAGAPIPTPPLADDDGAASPALVQALEEAAAGRGGGSEVLRALAGSRLLVPVVAVLDEAETGPDGLRRDKQSSMATVLVRAPDGRRSLLAFSGTESLRTWQDDARPVPLAAPLAARAAIDEGADALLVDVAGPVPFAVAEGELLLLAAASRPTGDPSTDPVARAAVRRAVNEVPGLREQLTSAHLVPAPVAEAPVQLVLVTGGAPSEALMEQLLTRLQVDRALAAVLPNGLRVTKAPQDSAPDTPDLLRLHEGGTGQHDSHG
jgi:hypothetical protein